MFGDCQPRHRLLADPPVQQGGDNAERAKPQSERPRKRPRLQLKPPAKPRGKARERARRDAAAAAEREEALLVRPALKKKKRKASLGANPPFRDCSHF